jgi:hypothetical protein
MTIFPNLQWFRKLAGDSSKASNPAAQDVKPTSAKGRQHTQNESPATAHRWTRQDTKAKIAEARKKWTWHDSADVVANIPSSEKETPPPRRPIYRMKSDLSAARVVKSSQTNLLDASAGKHPTAPLHDSKPSAPDRDSASPAPRYVPAPAPARQQRPNLRAHAIRNNTCGAPYQGGTTALPRMASVKKSLKRSASAVLPRTHTRPDRSDSHHELPPMTGISSPYSLDTWDLPSSTIPTWRYEELPPESKPPMIM